MKLSEFDLNWYQQWGIEHTPLEEWSRPGLTNGLGSLQLAADPSSIRHLIFPPVSGAEESTAYLTVNGTFLAATLNKTTVQWTPWEVRRKSKHEHWKIDTAVSMVKGEPGVIEAISITNDSSREQPLKVGFRLSGRIVNRGQEPWFWGVPKVELTTDALHGHSGLHPNVSQISEMGLLFQERPVEGHADGPLSYAGKAFNAQVLSPAPDRWLGNGDACYETSLAPGEVFKFYLAIAVGDSPDVVDLAKRILNDPDQEFVKARVYWQNLWKSVFNDDAPLTGKLEDLSLPDEIAPVAASAILCGLMSRRTFPVTGLVPAYNISMPRRVEACFYPNDWALAGELLAEMDPDPTWRQLEMALKADIRKNNQINLLTGKAGDWSGDGWPYTIDIFNCFYTALQLWNAEGRLPEQLLERKFNNFDGRILTLLEVFEDLAFDWRSRKVESLGLADYGPKEELLECVSTYAHVVAGLNAGAAWMLDELAEIYELMGDSQKAVTVRKESNGITDAILEHLYVEGNGYFRCVDREGHSSEVRHCWDFGMVGFCIGKRLSPQTQKEMTDFFKAELYTPTWLRALSPHDADAATSGIRADHQYNGAFGAWPAQCALALLNFGEKELVEQWILGIAKTARQGPFAQAHYDEAVWPATHEGATKVTEEVPQCTHWSNISGGLFWAVVKALS